MADSDSEAFESADEEVEDKKSKKVSHENKTPEVVPTKPDPPKDLPLEQPKKDEPPQKVETPSSWRSWGAFSVISNASKHVASITTQVSQSISTAIDSMNIPDPEEMAKMHVEQKKAENTQEDLPAGGDRGSEKSEDSLFKLDSLLSGVTQISSKVVSGGLDTLEGIGKKTINILQETDPNIKNKLRGITVNSQPNLSDLLKEAKERVDEPAPAINEIPLSSVSFEHLLDEYKGLVYLEALVILSNQSKMKIELLMKPLSGKILTEMEETLTEVKELCELDVDNLDESLTAENFESKLQMATEDLKIKLNFSAIVSEAVDAQDWLEGVEADLELNVIYEKSIQVLAKLCALSLNNLQKLAELLLSQEHRSTADEADSLTQLTLLYCSLFNYFAVKFTEKMTATNKEESKKFATNVYLESANAVSHIKNAFNLFLPVLQIGAV